MALTWDQFAATYGDSPLGKLSDVHNSKLFDTMANQIAKAIGFTGKTWAPGTYQFENVNEGGTFMDTAQGKKASPEFLKALQDYQFQRTSPTQGAVSQNGQTVGTFTAGNKDTGFDQIASVAVPLALSAIGGQLAGGLLAGGGTAATSAAPALNLSEAVYGVGGALGPGIEAGTIGGLSGATGAFGGIGSVLPTAVSFQPTAGLLSSIATAAPEPVAPPAPAPVSPPPISPADKINLLSANGMTDAAIPTITADPLPAIESFVNANPVTAADLVASTPNVASIPITSSVPSVYNAAQDSQAASAAAGITGDQAATAATVPKTVNLSNAGGTMGTAGGIQGTIDAALQNLSEQGATSSMGGGGASTIGSTVNDLTTWMKANPTLGRLLLGGATTLLSGLGNDSGSTTPSASVGPAKKWNSPLQQGLLTQVNQINPPALTRPAGLLAQGYANDGAWRYLKG